MIEFRNSTVFVRGILSLAYVLWLLGILMLAWGTMPYLSSRWGIVPPPPAWLTSLTRLIFYRDYIF